MYPLRAPQPNIVKVWDTLCPVPTVVHGSTLGNCSHGSVWFGPNFISSALRLGGGFSCRLFTGLFLAVDFTAHNRHLGYSCVSGRFTCSVPSTGCAVAPANLPSVALSDTRTSCSLGQTVGTGSWETPQMCVCGNGSTAPHPVPASPPTRPSVGRRSICHSSFTSRSPRCYISQFIPHQPL